MFFHAQEFDKALNDANEVLRLDPKNAMALKMRGDLLLMQGHAKEAMADLNKSVENDPKSVNSLVSRKCRTS